MCCRVIESVHSFWNYCLRSPEKKKMTCQILYSELIGTLCWRYPGKKRDLPVVPLTLKKWKIPDIKAKNHLIFKIRELRIANNFMAEKAIQWFFWPLMPYYSRWFLLVCQMVLCCSCRVCLVCWASSSHLKLVYHIQPKQILKEKGFPAES